MTSLWPRIEPLLAGVEKPARYIGMERGSRVPVHRPGSVSWLLVYPDTYEIGLPNQGLQILYEILNERDDAVAERSYAPWLDLAAALREHAVPLFSVDTHRAASDFDIVAFNLSAELVYTNLLECLDLAGIPIRSEQRSETDPLVVAGGHSTFNPEPMADFVDAFVIGDGEEPVGEMTECVRSWQGGGRPGGRVGLLRSLASVAGVYVPSMYSVEFDGPALRSVTPRYSDVPAVVDKRTVADLADWPYPKEQLVPLIEVVHDRLNVELFRGCTRGCRFCQAGMITRPVRERSITGVGEMVKAGLEATGYEEVGLLSLSSADHSEIAGIAKGLADRYEGTQTSLSLPSTRVDAFNIDLAQELARNGRRSGLTFAPEGGSERLRKVINKTVSKQDLIDTVTAAYGAGWRQVKLYFMCGLPTETDDDVLEIADMAREVIRAGRQVTGSRDVRCTVSIGGFVPKPHTPFQWVGQLDPQTTDHRLKLLRDAISADKSTAKAIGYRYHDGKPGQIEGLLSRGDRRIGRVIERVWRDGGVFDGWREHFSYERWVTAAAEELAPYGLDLAWYTSREREEHEVLPWDHLDSGLDKEWLWADWLEALDEQELDDCRWIPCFDCGVCPQMGTEIQIGPTGKTLLPLSVV